MPLPQGYLPREGDVLVVHAVVKYDVSSEDQESVFVRPLGYYSDCRLNLSTIVGLHARKWEPGEAATHAGAPVTVIAVDDDQAWVKYASGGRASVHVNSLDAVPEAVDPVDLPFTEPVKPPAAPSSVRVGPDGVTDEEIQF
jgi:hypothetical protein